MGLRNYDILLFGATGFTGKYVLRELIRAQSNTDLKPSTGEGRPLTIAIAGRSKNKLEGNVLIRYSIVLTVFLRAFKRTRAGV